MTDQEIFAIKAGDKLLLTQGDKIKIEIVDRVTPTQIITDNGHRFYRVHKGRGVHPGVVVGDWRVFQWTLERIATPRDIARKRAETKKAEDEIRRRTEEKNARDAKRNELSILFRAGIYVDFAQFHDEGNEEQTFDITNLTEDEVRAVALCLAELTPAKG